MALTLAVPGLVVVLAAAAHYFATIPKETVPKDVRPHSVVLILGAAMGVAGIVVSATTTTIALGATSVVSAASLLWLFAQRHLPDAELVVAVGDPMPTLEARDQDGRLVRLDDFKGRRVLFKFFRGFW
ncbi:MAG: hypothetical protein E4H03_09205 [Myxococcales bacterium]|jgi:hypothetical protein|nr:MAG: hypothetical protein E4H03_09205 [Myxococcales bacterium]